MNAERLLRLYERIADAPDAIQRLRRFVLDLAVRGKLSPQDRADEPASDLLKRIAVEKASRTNRGERRLLVPDVPARAPIAGFDLPVGWVWSSVGELCEKTGSGSTPRGGKAVYRTEGIAFLRSQNVHDDGLRLSEVAYIDAATHAQMSGTAVRSGDLLLNITGGSIGRCCIVPDGFPEANVSQHVAIIRVALEGLQDFLHQLVLSPYFQAFVLGEQTGAGRGGLPKNRMDRIPVALPPLGEQGRIVAKVDELMVLCDDLEKARAEREAARDRLAGVSLVRLNAPDPNPVMFASHARFALSNLDALTARPDQIKRLRQTILSLAVRGKLVRQNPDEGAAVSLDGANSDWQVPFEIPLNWSWIRLRSLGRLKGGGTPSKARSDFWNGEIPWVSPKDMKREHIDSAQMRITGAAIAGSAATLIEAGSILFVVRGMILAHSFPVALADVPLTINQDMKALVLKKPEMGEFVLRALKGLKPEMLALVKRSSHGTCRIEGADYSAFLIPVPPFAEQRRIVTKVDELMALCDQLETSLSSGAGTRCRLLDALVAEALLPVASEAA